MFPFPCALFLVFLSAGLVHADPQTDLMTQIRQDLASEVQADPPKYCHVISGAYGKYPDEMRKFTNIKTEYCTGIMKSSPQCEFLLRQPSNVRTRRSMAESISQVLTEAYDKLTSPQFTGQAIVEQISYMALYYSHYQQYQSGTTPHVDKARAVCDNWNVVADMCYGNLRITFKLPETTKKACGLLFELAVLPAKVEITDRGQSPNPNHQLRTHLCQAPNSPVPT